MSKKFGVVLIGCGYIGEEHLADIYYRDNIRMVAVVEGAKCCIFYEFVKSFFIKKWWLIKIEI